MTRVFAPDWVATPSPQGLFHSTCDPTCADHPQWSERGLLINAALESRIPAPGVAQALQALLRDMELRFRDAIERACGANEVAGHVDPVHTARALLALYLGLCTLVRSGAGEPVLRAVGQQALSLLPVHAAERWSDQDQGGR